MRPAAGAASTSTRENFSLSKAVIETDMRERGRDGEAPATTNYHVFRRYVFAHDAGLAAEGVSAPTRWYFWPNAISGGSLWMPVPDVRLCDLAVVP